MAMVKEKYYLTRDNTIDLTLKADGVAANLTTVTRITLSFDDTLLSSTNQDDDPVLWNQSGYDTGEIRLFLKDQGLTAGYYRVPIIVYTALDDDGVVWGYVLISVIADPEAS